MKKTLLIGTFITGSIFASLVYCSGSGEESGGITGWSKASRLDVAPVNNELYRSECASCHFGYQPGLLPARSWVKIMSGLEDHFGDNAELDPDSHARLLRYLVKNAADLSNYKRSRRITNSLSPDEAPLRITDTLYFKRQHREISLTRVKNNPEIGSFSNCIACHSQADKGSFNEREIKIPGSRRGWN
ncbi:MAG: diheme cytochrome c [Gammaproteobacteria bacterium]|nr:diheme cytochrome c [Gammaproteobacteria bacterium]MDH5592061.1 diheme cytochrome c [Gammaproteobacteria bacterium]